MKRFLVLLLFCLVLTGSVSAEEKTEQTTPSTTSSFLLPMPDIDGKWGYINQEGKFKIPPQYDYACEFRGNYAMVVVDQEKDDYCHEGIIDRNGNMVLEPLYNIDAGYDGGYYGGKDTGIWCVLRYDEVPDESMGFFDIPSGHFSGFHWSDIWHWCSESHLIPVMDNECRVGYAERSSGEMVIPYRYDFVDPSNFYGGVAAVCLISDDEDEENEGCIILIDEAGREITLPEGIHAVQYEGAFDDRVLVINDEGLYGFTDSQGNIVIEPQFIDAGHFYKGRAAVGFQTDEYGFIDTTGTVTERGLKNKPDWEDDYSDGITYEVDDKAGNNIVIVKKYCDDKEEPEAYGFYDKQSGFLQMPMYEEISEYTDRDEPLIAVCQNQHWGFCKRDSGELVIPCVYDDVDDYVNGFAIGSSGEQDDMFFADQYELFDREGKKISFPDGMNPVDLLRTDEVWFDQEGKVISFSDGIHSVDLLGIDTIVLIMQRTDTGYLFGLGSTDGSIILEPYAAYWGDIYEELGVLGFTPGG